MEKFKKMFGWLNVSNRKKHLFVGMVIYLTMLLATAFCMFCFDIVIDDYLSGRFIALCSIQSLLTTLVAMCSVEYTQCYLCHVGLFDKLDILAGCLVPMACTIILPIVC